MCPWAPGLLRATVPSLPSRSSLVGEVKIGWRLNTLPTQAKETTIQATDNPRSRQMGSSSFIHPSILHTFLVGCARYCAECLRYRTVNKTWHPLHPHSSGRQDDHPASEVLSPSDWGAGEVFLEGWCLTECWKENKSLTNGGKRAFRDAGESTGKNKKALNTAWLSRGGYHWVSLQQNASLGQ